MLDRLHERSFGFALVVGLLGCSGGEVRDPGGTPAGGNGGGSNGGASGGGGIEIPLPPGTDAAALLPARIRRLTNAEYDATVTALVPPLTPPEKTPAEEFAPDARQSGFTLNDAQRVDPVIAKQLAATADAVAASVKARAAELAPCANMAEAEACAGSFIDAFGAKAYRRPLDAAEREGLLAVYRAGIEEAAYADGIELVVSAMLQSAGFLYLTELGAGAGVSGVVSLTPYELASSLSYTFTAGPPSQALVEQALAGELATPEGREAAVWEVLAGQSARDRVIRVVAEWLGIDRIDQIAKDSTVYPEFDALKEPMRIESGDFIASVLSESTRTVGEILSADWSKTSNAALAGFYGASAGPNQRITFSERRGILNQAAFLSVYAHATESAPVLRGVAVARRLACLPVPSPTSQNIVVVTPPPDPTKTTRERFAQHSTDPSCFQCHKSIDPFGFSFEQFDGMGRKRTMDNGKPVDSSVTIALGTDFDGAYADSNALAVALGESAAVRQCFARHVFRAMAGNSDAAVRPSEDEFVEFWSSMGTEKQRDVVETLVAFARSPIFAHRRTE